MVLVEFGPEQRNQTVSAVMTSWSSSREEGEKGEALRLGENGSQVDTVGSLEMDCPESPEAVDARIHQQRLEHMTCQVILRGEIPSRIAEPTVWSAQRNDGAWSAKVLWRLDIAAPLAAS
jgi:hypothetical protein